MGDELFINAINFLLAHAIAVDHAYYHLLSGADLPLKPQSEIHAFFASHAEKSLSISTASRSIRICCCSASAAGTCASLSPVQKEIVSRVQPLWLGAQKRLGINRLKAAASNFKRARFGFPSHTIAPYMPCRRRGNTAGVMKTSVCADELWLQTVLVNSAFMEKRAFMGFGDEGAATMRYVDWSGGGRSRAC